MCGPKSRWKSGNERYPNRDDRTANEKYKEQPGWRNGAKVYKR